MLEHPPGSERSQMNEPQSTEWMMPGKLGIRCKGFSCRPESSEDLLRRETLRRYVEHYCPLVHVLVLREELERTMHRKAPQDGTAGLRPLAATNEYRPLPDFGS